MENHLVVVLGGYGGAGRRLCRELLARTDARVAVAGRDARKAVELSAELDRAFPGRAEARTVDTSQADSLSPALEGARVVVAATTSAPDAPRVASAALDAGADYVDLFFAPATPGRLAPHAERARELGRVLVTQGGFHPGLPAVYARRGAAFLDRYDSARVAFVMHERVEDPRSIAEIVDMVADFHADVWDGGAWRRAGSNDALRVDFGPDFGRRTCWPMDLAEMRELPAKLGLRQAGVYVAGFNAFTDYVVFPLAALSFALRRGLLRDFWARALAFGINRFSRTPEGVVFVLLADGLAGGKPTRLEWRTTCDSAYGFTVLPVVSCIGQLLDGTSARPGLHCMGLLVDPERTLDDLARWGVRHELRRFDTLEPTP